MRSNFSAYQLYELRRAYTTSAYLTFAMEDALTEQLGLTAKQIRVSHSLVQALSEWPNFVTKGYNRMKRRIEQFSTSGTDLSIIEGVCFSLFCRGAGGHPLLWKGGELRVDSNQVPSRNFL